MYKEGVLRTVERQAEIQQHKKAIRQLKTLGYDPDEIVLDEMEVDTFKEFIKLAEQEISLSDQNPKKKKHQGHYCRKCGRYRANEKFSGKGHAKHICKECQKEMRQHARQKRKERLAKQTSSQNDQEPSSEGNTGNE